jgi:enamine deaminase RidA (YjgF/YER057c/UK114 family)
MSDVVAADKEIDAFSPKGLVPAVTHVEWTLGSPIEIEMIAWAPQRATEIDDPVKYLAPPHLKHSPVFSRIAIVETGRLVFVSGLAGDAGQTGEQQVRTTFDRLKTTLEKAGSDFRHMAKATYYVSDDDPSTALNKVRPELYDPARPPAASKAGVKSVAVPGRGLVLDIIAAQKE